MKTLCDQELVDELRKKGDSIKKRLWISSPYVGKKKPLFQILGNKWKKEENIDFKLLVDYSNPNNCNFDTLKNLFDLNKKKFSIRTLTSLHAKIYIFDDECLVTSANLTPTAFEYRCEIGIFLNKEESNTAIKIFNSYWNESKELSQFDIKKIKGGVPKVKNGNEFKSGFKKRNKLPKFDESQGWLKLLGYSDKKRRQKNFLIRKNSPIYKYSFLGTPNGSTLKENDIVILLRLAYKNKKPAQLIYGRARVDIPQKDSNLDLREFKSKIIKNKKILSDEDFKNALESINEWNNGFWIKDLELIQGDENDFIDLNDLKDNNGKRLIEKSSTSNKSHIRLNDFKLKIINEELDERLPKNKKKYNPKGIWLNNCLLKSDEINKEDFRIQNNN